ncbi:alpha/beta hydrolase [Plantibacter flavus]|nr:alpha/beta hydrolase [Plantibacter flavus]
MDDTATPARPAWSRTKKVFTIVMVTLWVVVVAISILGLLLPAYPGKFLLAAGLLTGLVYPFLTVAVIVGIVIVLLAWKRGRRVVATVAAALSVLLAIGIAWPTVGAVAAAEQAKTQLSVSQLLQSAPTEGSPAPLETQTYRTVDGEDLDVDVWAPVSEEAAEKANHASLVYVFGGGWVAGDRTMWSPFFQYLTAQGITVFSIDYRLSTAEQASWSTSISDVRCAIGWVHEEADTYDIDPKRIAISGGSAGANLALLAGYTSDEPAPDGCGTDTSVRAVIDYYGPTDLAAVEAEAGSTVVDMLHTYLGATAAEEPERYAELSPLTHVSPSSPPTLIIHGTHDGMVPTNQSERLAAALDDAGVKNHLVLIGGAQHGFDMIWGTLAGQAARAEVMSFMERYVIG